MKASSIKILISTTFLLYTCFINAQQNVTWKQLDEKALYIDSLVYKKTATTDLSLYYFLPEKIKSKEKYPCIVFIHGGAWTGGAANVFYAYAAYLAKRNMVAVSIDYRLIGQPNTEITHCIEDAKSAIRYLKKNAKKFSIDTNKIVICGESAGGHLAALMELSNEWNATKDNTKISTKPAALILLNPVLNLTTNTFIKYVDGDLVRSKAKLPDSLTLQQKYLPKAKNISPLFLLQKTLPPTLLINGMNDKITPYEYAQAFVDSANKLKQNCQLILLTNTGHAFAVPHYKASEAEVVKTLQTIETFLVELKLIRGESTIVNGHDENWIIKK